MKQITTLAAAILLAMGLAATPAFAGDHHKMNPCNPCAMKGDMKHNPCSMKGHKMNPCNPCSMKDKMGHKMNPCSMKDKMKDKAEHKMNPCNPCSMKKHHKILSRHWY